MIEKSINISDTVLNASEMKKESIVDICFAFILFGLSFIALRFTNIFQIGWLHTILMMSYLAVSAVYVWFHQHTITRKNMYLLIFIFIECLPNALFTNIPLKILNVMFVNVLQLYWVLNCCGHLADGKQSNWILLDFIVSAVILPWHCLKKAGAFLMGCSLQRVRLKTVFMVLIGLLLSLPLLVIILPQLAMADEVFSNLFYQVFLNMDQFFSYLFTFVITIPFFLYFFSAYYGNTHNSFDTWKRKQKVERRMHNLSKISPVIMTTIEVVLCSVYLLFIGTTIYNMMHTIMNPEMDFVYSAYARSGFFELCRISCINFIVLIMIELCIEKANLHFHTIVKRILCLETVGIILSALFKMGMYINAYGFTYKRIYSAWLMMVLLGVFMLMLYHTFKKGDVILNMIRYVCICFMILNMINVDGLVEQTIFDNAGQVIVLTGFDSLY